MSALLWRQAEIAVGFLVAGFILFVLVAVATWNVADPSFSHATDAPITNVMGFAGSAVSDLFMQFFGLATLAVLIPAGFKSFSLVRGIKWNYPGRRYGAWLLGSLLAAAAFGCVPATAGWPLPTGLGGALGDLVLKIPAMLIGGYPSGFAGLLLGLILAIPAFIVMAIASGYYWNPAVAAKPQRSVSGQKSRSDEDEDEDEETGDGFLKMISLGAVLHGFYAFKASIKRLFPTKKSMKRGINNQQSKNIRVEPGLSAQNQYSSANIATDHARGDMNWASDDLGDESYASNSSFTPTNFDNFEVGADEDWSGAEDWAPSSRPKPSHTSSQTATAEPTINNSARVTSVTPRPKPSVRVQREAQPSLLNDGGFELPPIHLLNEPKNIVRDESLSKEALEQNARVLEGVLEDFGVRGEIIAVRPGPVVTMYELEPAPGIKSSRVIGLAEDIARSMSAIAARVAVVPGRNAIGIELPNLLRETVYFREMIASANYDISKAKLPMALGKTINGEPVIADLAKMPHLLVAGTTGSGKSVAINTMLLSLLYKMTPAECRLIMIDPKMLELSVYDGIPHLLTPVVTDPKKAVVALKWTVREMEQRYKNMSKLGVRNIDGFNARVKEATMKGEEITRTVQTGFDRETGEAIYESEALNLEAMPYIVVIIDEMADLMMVAGKDIEGAVQRLAQMARAAGIHVVMATQRPSVDVITGTIKANFPTRISFQVTSKIDSRTILGEMGAEQLLGMGDMLYMAGGGRIQRVHGPFVSDTEVEDIVKHLKLQGVPQYLEAVTVDDEDEDGENGSAGSAHGGGDGGSFSDSDDPYDQAVSIVLRDRKASTSYIQRRLGIGYNRAASLIERMENEGLIGAANHAGKREILVPSDEEQQMGGMM
ncbi:MAG: DNA translocase FtsK [Ahrensia sp.]|nr:DNA translocase FtsK [Ahrensia sp.]